MTQPLRILMVCHMPWDRNLGGSRVQVELADEFRMAGHQVDKFSFEDAFPRGRARLRECLDPCAFARRARAFVQKHAADYDIIDAHQGNLPYSKKTLRFSGLLAARSVGLHAFYERFSQEERTRWPRHYHGSWMGRVLRRWQARWAASTFPRSLRTADLINVCNEDEGIYVRDVLGLGAKCVLFPFGMSAARQESFRKNRPTAEYRLVQQTVAFVGYWAPRKGAYDWGEVVRCLWAVRPNTRFLFLGTGRGENVVRADLGVTATDNRVKVVSSYPTSDLPELLRGATVGAFPSYIEGFPFGVLELLAAGLPTIAYDVPGNRELLRRVDSTWLGPPGDTFGFGNRLTEMLESDPAEYRRLSEAGAQIAYGLGWPWIAQETLKYYERQHRRVRQTSIM